MCGIVGLHLRGERLADRTGDLLARMLAQVADRGPDSAGVGLYGDDELTCPGWSTVSLLSREAPERITADLALPVTCPDPVVRAVADVRTISADLPVGDLVAAVRASLDGAVIGSGEHLAVLKGIGSPVDLVQSFALPSRCGYQAVGHTRMATESAVTLAHGHPFSVRPELCLVHNGSFSNHDTVRRELRARGVQCETDNDSEVAARFLGRCLDGGNDLEKSLRLLIERFEGFFTLLVTTETQFAVVRDRVSAKPAVLAETDDWVALASEYRALAVLPGLQDAHVYEPGPEEVHLWTRQ
jgi:methylamine---glutamate N-methyltransferase subunit A